MKQIVIDDISTSYYVTEDGKCYNEKTGKWLKGQSNYKNKYFSYNLTLPDGSKKRCYAHRLVAIAFIPNNDPNKKYINHKDGNKLNNCVDNLEWVTHEENIAHSVENEYRKVAHVFCFNKDKKLVAEYKNIEEAHKATGVAYSQIYQEFHKTPKALAGGFYWSETPELGETIFYPNTGKAKEVYQYTKDGKFITSYPSCGTAARAIGGGHGHIGECCRGKLKSYKGFVWRYAEDIVSPSLKNEESVSEHS